MRRVLAIAAVLVVAGVAAFLAAGAGSDDSARTYKIVFDNAFGLTDGVDLKVGGVRAGSVDKLDIERRTGRALVTVKLNQPGFSDFRADASCAIRPQSLIGEYFVDCQPGTKGKALGKGGTIPVAQTETTIPPDIVQNILRRPYRERFGLILNELGGALASRGPDLNATIRRAIPALTQTDRVLKILADNREELVSLNVNSAEVLSRLADRRTDVTRFVREARDAASISASRRTDLATTIRRLPGFLSELRPTLADLGTTAELQTPALNDLSAAAGDLTTFFNRLGPFSEATEPALDSLGETSKVGIDAVEAATPTVAQLRALTTNAPELSNNLAIVLEHLNDREFAVEKSPGAPGKGYTGLEAILQYPYVQSQAINLFDQRGYVLKLLILANQCSSFTNAESAKANPARFKQCMGGLGPNRPGVTTPDPSGAKEASVARRSTGSKGSRKGKRRSSDKDRDAKADRPDGGGGSSPSAPDSPGRTPSIPDPSNTIDDTLDDLLPNAPKVPDVPALPKGEQLPDKSVLDFLFGP